MVSSLELACTTTCRDLSLRLRLCFLAACPLPIINGFTSACLDQNTVQMGNISTSAKTFTRQPERQTQESYRFNSVCATLAPQPCECLLGSTAHSPCMAHGVWDEAQCQVERMVHTSTSKMITNTCVLTRVIPISRCRTDIPSRHGYSP